MPGPTGYRERSFYEWLGDQRSRRDDIGRFARDVWDDVHFPRGLNSETDLVRYMQTRGAGADAIEAAREAWEEFGEEATTYTPPDQIVDWDRDEDEDRR